MTEEEYKRLMGDLEMRYLERKRKLQAAYAKSMARYKVGDIVESESHNLLEVREVVYVERYGRDMVGYKGVALTKALKPKVRQETAITYMPESNVKRKVI